MRRFILAFGLAISLASCVAARAEPPALRIALFASFPPMAYKIPETNELAGLDVDLANYVGRKLGRSIVWQDVSYEQAIPALITGRVDLAFSLLDEPDSRDRLLYVGYLKSGIQAYTLTSHTTIGSLAELCGQKLGANRRNGFADRMREWSVANCTPLQKPPIQVENTDGTQAARLQLGQGRVDAIVQSSESVAYTFKQEPGRYVRIDRPLPGLSIAVTFPKANTELRDQVARALHDAVLDGTYAAALEKFELTDNSAAPEILAAEPKH